MLNLIDISNIIKNLDWFEISKNIKVFDSRIILNSIKPNLMGFI